MRAARFLVLIAGLAVDPALARRAPRPAALTPDTVNQAQWTSDRRTAAPDPILLKAQVLFDRNGFSPGAIDAWDGENFQKAIRAFQNDVSPHCKRTAGDDLHCHKGEPHLQPRRSNANSAGRPFWRCMQRSPELCRRGRLVIRNKKGSWQMPDNLKLRNRPDRSKINMHEAFEVRYWTRHLGVTKEELAATVDKVGNAAAAVRKELRLATP